MILQTSNNTKENTAWAEAIYYWLDIFLRVWSSKVSNDCNISGNLKSGKTLELSVKYLIIIMRFLTYIKLLSSSTSIVILIKVKNNILAYS